MKLENELYEIIETLNSDKMAVVSILLLSDSVIYKAHFPGEPVTPGVCIIKIAMELIEQMFDRPLQLRKVKNVKFLRVITPVEQTIDYEIQLQKEDDNNLTYQVTVTKDDVVYTKMSLICIPRI